MNIQQFNKVIALSITGLSILFLASNTGAADIDKLIDPCSQCHERNGASDDPNMPIIGGYSEIYIISSMTSYKERSRSCPEIEFISHEKRIGITNMCDISSDLSETDIEQIAQYYASKKFRRANQNFDPESARKGALIHERDCEKCHSDGGSVADDDAGILAGQWKPYLKQQFFAFYSEKRKLDRKMKPKFNKLDKTEVDALLNFYASRGI